MTSKDLGCIINPFILFPQVILLMFFMFSGCSVTHMIPGRDSAGLTQRELNGIIENLGLETAVQEKRLALALVDIRDIANPKFVGINSEHMMYAASVPKIVILYALFKKLEEGTLNWNPDYLFKAEEMIQKSSNSAATELFYVVGPEYIKEVLTSPVFKLYDPENGGGLWLGKEYGKGAAIYRDPLKGLSHAATAYSIVKFYYLLESGQLLTGAWAERFKSILSKTAFNSKFVRGLKDCCPEAKFYRKAGAWLDFNADSIVVQHGYKRYILAGIAIDPAAEFWFEKIIQLVDRKL